MGNYESDDIAHCGISAALVGRDCPFNDSLVIAAADIPSLESKIAYVVSGSDVGFTHELFGRAVGDYRGRYPDIIFDYAGNLLPDVQRRICADPGFSPDARTYSYGRDSVKEFWERERWRFLPGEQGRVA